MNVPWLVRVSSSGEVGKNWSFEGLGDDTKRSAMSRLLENQAAQLLKEASSMAAGDVEGFASVTLLYVVYSAGYLHRTSCQCNR